MSNQPSAISEPVSSRAAKIFFVIDRLLEKLRDRLVCAMPVTQIRTRRPTKRSGGGKYNDFKYYLARKKVEPGTRRGGKHSGLIILDSKSGGQKICCPEYRTHKPEIWFQTGVKNLHFLSRVFSRTLMVNRPLRVKSPASCHKKSDQRAAAIAIFRADRRFRQAVIDLGRRRRPADCRCRFCYL